MSSRGSDESAHVEATKSLEQLKITAEQEPTAIASATDSVGYRQRFDFRRIEKTAKRFGLNFNEDDLRSLTICDEQLHDYVIDLYLQLVIERANASRPNAKPGLPSVYAFSSSFLYSYENYHYDAVKGAIDDIHKYDLLLFPANESGVHWCLAAVHTRTSTIEYYDPLWNQKNDEVNSDSVKKVDTIRDYLEEETASQGVGCQSWTVQFVRDIPVQQNGYDCGVFVCKYAECIVLKREMSFDQNQMAVFRDQIARCMENGELAS